MRAGPLCATGSTTAVCRERQLVIGALRAAVNQDQDASDRDLIQMRLDQAIVYRDRIEITLQTYRHT